MHIHIKKKKKCFAPYRALSLDQYILSHIGEVGVAQETLQGTVEMGFGSSGCHFAAIWCGVLETPTLASGSLEF